MLAERPKEPKIHRRFTNGRSPRRGVLVVLFALMIPLLIIILGFTIDYANMQRVRNEARMVSDLAAKAAADTLSRTAGDQQAARQAAIDVAAANTIAGVAHNLASGDVVFGQAIEQSDGSFSFQAGGFPLNSVRVFTRRTEESLNGRVPLFFGMFYGQPTFDLVQSATASFRKVEVCLVLDRSGSMKFNATGSMTSDQKEAAHCSPPGPDSRWAALDNAIDGFLDELAATPISEKVALVTFASDDEDCDDLSVSAATLDQSLTTSMSQIETVMDGYNNGVWFGSTNITAGLHKARLHMESHGSPNLKRYIIVFTDGQHNQGDPPFSEAAACAESGITVHTITFGDSANTADMIATASNGGGEHYHADGSTELENIFSRLATTFAILTE